MANEDERLGLEAFPQIEEDNLPEQPTPLNHLPVVFLKRFSVVPLEDTGDRIKVAMADPLDFNTRDVLKQVYGKPLEVYRGSKEVIQQLIYQWYEAEADITQGDRGQEDAGSPEEQLWDSPEQLKDMASEAPVVRLVNHLITRAINMGASDIHIEPRRHYVQVRYRIDGILHDQESISGRLRSAITSRIKLMARMDIAEMRLPQDGRIKYSIGRNEIDIRVSSVPVQFGESLVLRLLSQGDIHLDLESLGFPQKILERFKFIISSPHGIILVCGPTGSGKTTTLYAALNQINSPDKKIVTVEDPVEYQLEGIDQVQVKQDIGLTFASCLRSFLRHDPDVMLVGEIRDIETAEIAIHSALTGHLVFSTLHTNDAAGAVTRLEDMGIEKFMIVSTLIAALSQRLVRKTCPHCKEEVRLSDEEIAALSHALSVPVERIEQTYLKGMGCKECAGTGYRGRVGLFELLEITEELQRIILKGGDRNQINKAALQGGMVSLKMDGLEKVKQGITTYEEILRVAR